ncbi:MAG: hypothetical protein ABOK23_12900 [Candidatus Methanoperedens sp.]|nr:hypothetical protein [Candidatus Methanoperedens sp.]MCZ7396029.1 hypothetical protein [Candidatus Methanoperedens sp.]
MLASIVYERKCPVTPTINNTTFPTESYKFRKQKIYPYRKEVFTSPNKVRMPASK